MSLPPPVLVPNYRLDDLNTFGLPSVAETYTAISGSQQLNWLFENGHFGSGNWRILGGGSNVLLSPQLPGLLLHMDTKGIQVDSEDSVSVTLAIAAGETWHQLVLYTLEQGWGGLENMSLIPGKVGAAPIQNIGAYGVELKDVCTAVEVFYPANGKTALLPADQLGFGYRDSWFKQHPGQCIITAVQLRLTKPGHHQLHLEYGAITQQLADMGLEPSPQTVSQAVIAIRQSKLPDPAKEGNTGSFFKNPTIPAEHAAELKARYPAMPVYPGTDGGAKMAAGWLIEQCGWKGKHMEGAGCYPTQALVLYNRGGATQQQVLALASAIQQSVAEKFGVALQPEVNVW